MNKDLEKIVKALALPKEEADQIVASFVSLYITKLQENLDDKYSDIKSLLSKDYEEAFDSINKTIENNSELAEIVSASYEESANIFMQSLSEIIDEKQKTNILEALQN